MIQLGETASETDLLKLPNCRIDIEGANVIVERQVTKEYGEGSVKESFKRGDWDITLAGTLVGKERDPRSGELYFPYDQLQALAKLLVVGKALRLVELKANALGIDRVVVFSYRIPDTPGANQSYIIRCKSDYPFELIVDAERTT